MIRSLDDLARRMIQKDEETGRSVIYSRMCSPVNLATLFDLMQIYEETYDPIVFGEDDRSTFAAFGLKTNLEVSGSSGSRIPSYIQMTPRVDTLTQLSIDKYLRKTLKRPDLEEEWSMLFETCISPNHFTTMNKILDIVEEHKSQS